MKHTNIEIKAICQSPDTVRNILQHHHADFRGTDHQVDTYFHVNHGRLKWRSGNIENHLIHYHRDNLAGPKQADILLYRTAPESSLKALLTAALGILTVVEKVREIYFIDNVKFHIDHVTNVGSFVEVEAIDNDGSISVQQLQAQCQHFIDLLGIQSSDFQSVSYSDMLLAKLHK